MKKYPKISIVINTLNRCKDLDRALQSLYYLDYPNFEVIVVNGPSTDDTAAVIEKYKNNIKIAKCPMANLSMSRNIGIAMAAGDYVAFMDDDAVPERDWLDKMLSGFDDKDVGGVTGDTYNPSGKVFQNRRLVQDRFLNIHSEEEALNFPYSFVVDGALGTNSMFSRDALIKIGCFNEQFDYFVDETDVCFRLVDNGYYVKHVAGAYIHHKFAPSDFRDSRKIVLDWTKITKNTVYIIKKYENVCGPELADKAIANILEARRQDSLSHKNSGLMSAEEYEKAIKSIDEGYKIGLFDAMHAEKFISQKTLDTYKTPFKQFETIAKLKDKKTIVYINRDYPPRADGGVARFIHILAVGMAKKGMDVHVITDSVSGVDTIDFEEGVWVHRVVPKWYPLSLVTAGLSPDVCVDHNRLNSLYTYYDELLRINSRSKVDVVHGSIWDSVGFYAMLDERFNSVVTLVTPFINVFENVLPRPNDHKCAIDLEHESVKICKNIHADSGAIIDEIKHYYPDMDAKKAKVIYLGVDDISENTIPEKHDYIDILFTGRLEQRKGTDTLLEAAAILCKKYDNVIFRLCGKDTICMPDSNMTYKQWFYEKYKDSNFIDRVIFEGFISEERLKQVYANCDVYVSPSRYESFGLIFVEAMTFGKPCVGCDVGAMPEVIKDKETGFLAKVGDVDSLVECLEKLIKSDDLRKKMGRAGRKRYDAMFTNQKMVDNVYDYYVGVLSKK